MTIGGPGAALLVAMIVACDSYDSGPDVDEGISGMYQGTVEWTREGVFFSVRGTFSLTDNVGDIAGAFSTNRGQVGAVSGSVIGAKAIFSIDQSAPCPGTFSGTGLFSVGEDGLTRLTGTYSGTSPCTGHVSASFVLTRYPEGAPLGLTDPRA